MHLNKHLTLIYFLLLTYTSTAFSETFYLTAKDNLQSAINKSNRGDTLILSSGRYSGNFIVSKPLSIVGSKTEEKTIIDALGTGNAITLASSHIRIEHLTIVNWGKNLTEQNAAIFSNKKIDNQRVSHLNINNNSLKGDGFGIWLNNVTQTEIFNNTVQGNIEMRSADRGNGIQISNVTNSHIFNNETFETRDGIYVISSENNVIESNSMHDLRYGIHYMYSYDNTVKNNIADNTRAGFALMSSRRLLISGNTTTNSEDYGFLLNFITDSTFENNVIKNVWTKPENKVLGRDGKGLFVYNSGYNVIKNNIVDTTEIGIHLTAGSENIQIFGNSFINNPVQVKYVSNKKQEWSKEQRGNYWSNYLGWDIDNNGIGDTVFEPNDGIDKLVWQYPELKMLMDSPAVLMIRWVQKQFPVLKSPGVKDSYPLMRLPAGNNFNKGANQNNDVFERKPTNNKQLGSVLSPMQRETQGVL
ncbi:MAG: nitrous oxide reductase family maturation protein NosD [Pseudoalteromonas marina]